MVLVRVVRTRRQDEIQLQARGYVLQPLLHLTPVRWQSTIGQPEGVQGDPAAWQEEVARHATLPMALGRAGEYDHGHRKPAVPGRKLQKCSAAPNLDIIRMRADGQHAAWALGQQH
jgi:hypothetical protein